MATHTHMMTTPYWMESSLPRFPKLERGRCAEIDTGHTTAHLTIVTDLRLAELVDRFGRNHAQAVWDAGLAAIAQIDTIVRSDVPFIGGPGVRFENQARFHPRRYLAGLASALSAGGPHLRAQRRR